MPNTRAVAVSKSNARDLTEAVRDAFKEMLTQLEATQKAPKEGPRPFPSGIELISLTLRLGPNIEFSVMVAGKDAPKTGGSASGDAAGA